MSRHGAEDRSDQRLASRGGEKNVLSIQVVSIQFYQSKGGNQLFLIFWNRVAAKVTTREIFNLSWPAGEDMLKVNSIAPNKENFSFVDISMYSLRSKKR